MGTLARRIKSLSGLGGQSQLVRNPVPLVLYIAGSLLLDLGLRQSPAIAAALFAADIFILLTASFCFNEAADVLELEDDRKDLASDIFVRIDEAVTGNEVRQSRQSEHSISVWKSSGHSFSGWEPSADLPFVSESDEDVVSLTTADSGWEWQRRRAGHESSDAFCQAPVLPGAGQGMPKVAIPIPPCSQPGTHKPDIHLAHRNTGWSGGIFASGLDCPDWGYDISRIDAMIEGSRAGAALPVLESAGSEEAFALSERLDGNTGIRRPGAAFGTSERRQTDIALRESAQRNQLALESGNFAAWDVDIATWKFVSLSEAKKALYGRQPDDAFSWEDCLAAIHQDDRARVTEAISRAVRDGQNQKIDYRVVRPDNTVCWLLSHARLFDCGPLQNARLIGVTQDVTEQKLQEIDRAIELEKAKERADRDPLTDLLNHRAFYHRLSIEAARGDEDGVLMVVLVNLDNFRYFNDAYSHSIGDTVLRQVAERLVTTCRQDDTVARFGGDEFALIMRRCPIDAEPPAIESQILLQLQDLDYRPFGSDEAIPITASVGSARLNTANGACDCCQAVERAEDRMRRSKNGSAVADDADELQRVLRAGRETAGFTMLDALVTAVDNKDCYTRQHSEDVVKYSLMTARELKLPDETTMIVGLAALLHDVGKIGVPDAILRKPGSLTEEEFEAVKQHPQMGAAIVGATLGLEGTLDAIRHHHERWDGRGYPDGLFHEETPLMARIVSVADAYSAMTTTRPYRKGIERSIAEANLESGSGSQWDPSCVRAFLAALRRQE